MSAATTIQCPNCGSKKVKYLDDNLFTCINCETSFYVDVNKTTVQHRHTYNGTATSKLTKLSPQKTLLILLAIVGILLIIMIPTLFVNFSSADENIAQESMPKKDYTFDISSSRAFKDKSNALKIFMIGKVQASNYNDNTYKDKTYWAVYDAVKGSYDQINPVLNNNETVGDFFVRSESFRFDDGNIYSIVANILLYRYDINTKSMTSLNDDIIANVKDLQSGIAYIGNSSHKFSAVEIKSNTEKKVMYYPISKVYYADNFEQTVRKRSYPNEKPATFFFPTNNQPSYLVKYNAMYSMGYPFCFDPHIRSAFDTNENFKSASFSSYWVAASHLIDMEVLNTENKVYDMTLLDYDEGIVALGVKTSNVSSEKFMIQWQDYNGKLLWSSPSEKSHLYDFSGTVSKDNGLLFGNGDEYILYDNQGKLIKQIDLEELSFNLD